MQHINTTSIDDHPVLDPNFIESEFDKWFLAKAAAYGRKFFKTNAMQEVFEPQETFPGGAYFSVFRWIYLTSKPLTNVPSECHYTSPVGGGN